MKKILVTGGSGFIGSAVVHNLIAKSYEVTVFDRNPREHLHKYPPEVSVYYGDVTNVAQVIEAVQQNDGVIHLAAMLGTQETIDNPIPVTTVNTIGSLNVFNAIRQFNRRAVYIAVGNHWMNNPYSISKTTAERYAYMYNKESGTKIAVVRGMNVFGPGQKNAPVRKMMSNFIIDALYERPLTVYGGGTQIMDWIYVDDIAEILVRALVMEHNVYDRCFEAGLCGDTTVLHVAEKILELTGSLSSIDTVAMRKGEIPNSVVKSTEEKWNLEHLNWKRENMVSLDKGLEMTIAYYRAHKEEYAPNEFYRSGI